MVVPYLGNGHQRPEHGTRLNDEKWNQETKILMIRCSLGNGPPPTRVVHAIGESDRLGGSTKANTDTSDDGRGKYNVRVSTKIEVQHQRVVAFNQDFLACGNGLVNINDTVERCKDEVSFAIVFRI